MAVQTLRTSIIIATLRKPKTVSVASAKSRSFNAKVTKYAKNSKEFAPFAFFAKFAFQNDLPVQ